MCSECMTAILASEDEIDEDTKMFEQRLNISSGEDVILEGTISC